jgi:hypothetical protein
VHDDRKSRYAMLESVFEVMRVERAASWTETGPLRAECEDALERTNFDPELALSVLRGERELDDDPWPRCPCCGCDTYFRLSSQLGEPTLPTYVFVCEGCRYLELRARPTTSFGAWWLEGTRVRARGEDPGHPYRGELAPVIGDDAADDGDHEADGDAEAEPEEAGVPGDWSERRVCFDGACIGILDRGGRCQVCGRTSA